MFIAAAGLALFVAALTRASLSAFGQSQFLAAVAVVLSDLPFAGGWLLSAYGWGWPLARIVQRARGSCEGDSIVQWGLGVALLLWLDHALGAAGVMQAAGGAAAWGLIAAGIALALISHRFEAKHARHGPERLPPNHPPSAAWPWLLALPGVATMLVAATSAPGWLWSSEAHGYDVLEYHLQLPREWLALGRIQSLEHNVYSFAGSYVEAAYYHLAILADRFAAPPADGAIRAATACQLLHAGLAIWSAATLAALARRLTGDRVAASLAGSAFLNTPWVVVTGSMAYNEMALTGALALAWLRAASQGEDADSETGLGASREQSAAMAATIGFVVGVAIGAKLTALGSVLVPVAVVMALTVPLRRWLLSLAAACAGGLVALAPYLLRNGVATAWDNPVFPLFAGALGAAHWTPEQVARWNGAHASDLSWTGRFVEWWRAAFVQRQWAGWWFVGLLGAVRILPLSRHEGLPRERRRWVALGVCALVGQILFWLSFTHLQSRFLIPCIVPLALLPAATIAGARPTRMGKAATFAGALWIAGAGLWTAALYHNERDGQPATYIDGVPLRAGTVLPQLAEADQQALLRTNPDVFLSFATDPGEGVYLLGDATPFYILRPVVYHTTWDRSLLGEAVRARPNDPTAWAAALLDHDLMLVMVNYGELHRLGEVDGWYDPDVTLPRVERLLHERGTLVATWPDADGRVVRALYRLRR